MEESWNNFISDQIQIPSDEQEAEGSENGESEISEEEIPHKIDF